MHTGSVHGEFTVISGSEKFYRNEGRPLVPLRHKRSSPVEPQFSAWAETWAETWAEIYGPRFIDFAEIIIQNSMEISMGKSS